MSERPASPAFADVSVDAKKWIARRLRSSGSCREYCGSQRVEHGPAVPARRQSGADYFQIRHNILDSIGMLRGDASASSAHLSSLGHAQTRPSCVHDSNTMAGGIASTPQGRCLQTRRRLVVQSRQHPHRRSAWKLLQDCIALGPLLARSSWFGHRLLPYNDGSSQHPEMMGSVALQLCHQPVFPIQVTLHCFSRIVGPFIRSLVRIDGR
jgi:hypothetical protein